MTGFQCTFIHFLTLLWFTQRKLTSNWHSVLLRSYRTQKYVVVFFLLIYLNLKICVALLEMIIPKDKSLQCTGLVYKINVNLWIWMWFPCGKIYPVRSASLKVPSATGFGEASAAASVGAKATTSTGLNGFQGLDGQWKGLSSAAETTTSAEPDVLAAVVSSSEDSSLAEALEGDAAEDDDVGFAIVGSEGVGGTSNRKFLSGDQPGGRRLTNTWIKKYRVKHVDEWMDW